MNLRKLKFWSGMTAFILFATGIILALVLREILLPDDYGALTFDTYGGLGGIILYLMILASASVTLWIVLLFNDTDQPDILDSRTRAVVVLVSGGFSLITGLTFYTKYYILFAFFMPLASGFYIDHCYRKRYPLSLLRTYTNIFIFFGLMGGYIIATYLAWDDMWLAGGDVPPGLFSMNQFVSLVRIIFTIYFYVFINFIGSWVAENQRRISDDLSAEQRKSIARPEIKIILTVSCFLLLAIIAIHLVPWDFFDAVFMDAMAVFVALMFMGPSVLKLIALYGK
ncbi:MAG: hypothetical protein FP824_06215 [Euryarchaeota archaeon]|nr:hypothetical protein [Euryarchaeota archaeon]MBU4032935.1 hypothetical protein [Candidatus Thermoplasmatota archaeon]MBU4071175.1 hypothetical protein [Candidatus Thermoplasmatota archaeon]MBU4143871.1 hypothetical protein [Candidatus Thermoplasmatota archaeon]